MMTTFAMLTVLRCRHKKAEEQKELEPPRSFICREDVVTTASPASRVEVTGSKSPAFGL